MYYLYWCGGGGTLAVTIIIDSHTDTHTHTLSVSLSHCLSVSSSAKGKQESRIELVYIILKKNHNYSRAEEEDEGGRQVRKYVSWKTVAVVVAALLALVVVALNLGLLRCLIISANKKSKQTEKIEGKKSEEQLLGFY